MNKTSTHPKLSYLFCPREGHEMNQLNMVCLEDTCAKKGLICCLCLEEHSHLGKTMAFQRLVNELQDKLEREKDFFYYAYADNESGTEEGDRDIQEFFDHVAQKFLAIDDFIDFFRVQVGLVLDQMKENLRHSQADMKTRFREQLRATQFNVKEFFENIEMKQIIGHSFSRSDHIRSELNSFLRNLSIVDDRKSLRFSTCEIINRQKRETADLLRQNSKIIELSLSHVMQELQMLLMGNKIYRSQQGSAENGEVLRGSANSASNGSGQAIQANDVQNEGYASKNRRLPQQQQEEEDVQDDNQDDIQPSGANNKRDSFITSPPFDYIFSFNKRDTPEKDTSPSKDGTATPEQVADSRCQSLRFPVTSNEQQYRSRQLMLQRSPQKSPRFQDIHSPDEYDSDTPPIRYQQQNYSTRADVNANNNNNNVHNSTAMLQLHGSPSSQQLDSEVEQHIFRESDRLGNASALKQIVQEDIEEENVNTNLDKLAGHHSIKSRSSTGGSGGGTNGSSPKQRGGAKGAQQPMFRTRMETVANTGTERGQQNLFQMQASLGNGRQHNDLQQNLTNKI